MKVVILAGGLGTRISEETIVKPKPMVEIGDKPILWHIMKIYSHYGFNDFIICLGYKGYYIKEWFSKYYLYNSDVTIDLNRNTTKYFNTQGEKWRVTLIDTGENIMTGGRLKRVKDIIGNETFMETYGDGVGDVNIKKLLEFHKKHGKLLTLTAVAPPGRFGVIQINQRKRVTSFTEKGDTEGRMNAGFFVMEPKVIDYIKGDETTFEREPIENLTKDGEICAFFHNGFWQPMDTLADKNRLETMWQSGKAPWKVWKD